MPLFQTPSGNSDNTSGGSFGKAGRKSRRSSNNLIALRHERTVIVAQLEQVLQDAAWCSASDDQLELQEARRWYAQAAALQRSLDALDVKLLKAELDQL
jgi:hypothetical protein